jgi:hypothetical protein
MGKPQGKRPVGRRICRWKDNTEMDLKDEVVWIILMEGRDVLRELYNKTEMIIILKMSKIDYFREFVISS